MEGLHLSPEVLERLHLVEIRLDALPEVNPMRFKEQFPQKAIIATLRSTREGGYFAGTVQEQVSLYQKYIDSGADFVDLEFASAREILNQLTWPGRTQRILSHHTRNAEPAYLENTILQMRRVPAQVYKLVFEGAHLNDNLTAIRLLEKFAARFDNRLIVHVMGETGKISRILGAVAGNAWTYVSLEGHARTAPGQLTLGEAVDIFHLPDKKRRSKILGLLGNPLGQSVGWRLHNELIHRKSPAMKNDYIYLNFEVEDLQDFWKNWAPRIHGLSITIPHKRSIVQHLAAVSSEVQQSGVCNTAVNTGSGWLGYNTDLLAIEALLGERLGHAKGGAGLIVGTGATARSAIAALKRLQFGEIWVTGRNAVVGRELEDRFAVEFVPLANLAGLKPDCIVQTTPVGMFPNTDGIPPGSDLFSPGVVVLDVIYNPPVTRFLALARQEGCRIISGVEMFRVQARHQMELFLNLPVSLREVRDAWEDLELSEMLGRYEVVP